MAKKSFWLGMIGMVLTFGFMVVGCAGMSAASEEAVQAGAAVLGGKTAVIVPITLAERVKAKDSDTTITGITRMLAVSSAVNDYAKAVDEVAERNSADIATKLETAYSSFIEAYNAAFNTTLNKTSFDFGQKVPAINYFAKPSKETVAQITQLCTDNNAEYVVTILYQYVDGPVVTVMTTANTTRLNAAIVVLDKTGAVVSSNYAGSDEAPFRFTYIKGQMTKEEMEAAHDDLMLQLYDAFRDGLPPLAADL
jgi:hypothetical protein